MATKILRGTYFAGPKPRTKRAQFLGGFAPASITVTAVAATGSGSVALPPAVTGTAAGATVLISDTFTGTFGNPWNPANWTQATTTAGAVAVLSSNVGRMNLGTLTGYAGVLAMKYAGSAVADTEFTGQVTFQNRNTADGSLSLRCRADATLSSTTGYVFQIVPGSTLARIQKNVASVNTTLGSFTYSLAESAVWFYRFRVVGTALQARMWQGVEPGTWDIDVTDSAITTAGSFGLRGAGGSIAGCIIDNDNITITDGSAGAAPTVNAVPATGNASAPAPIVTGANGALVTAVRATGDSQPLAPTVSGTISVTGGGPALGTDVANAPTVLGAAAVAVTAVYATGNCSAPSPSVDITNIYSGGGAAVVNGIGIPPAAAAGPTVNAVTATGTAASGVPAVTGGATVAGVRGTGTSTPGVPTVTAVQSPSINAVRGTGTGSITAPTVVSGSTVTAVAGAATGTSASPVVTGTISVSTTAVAAAGTSTAAAPVITVSPTITAVSGTGTGAAASPVVSAIQTVAITVTAATGTAVGGIPSLGTGVTATVVRATVTGGAASPVVTGDANTTAVRATATGSAAAPTLFVGATATATAATGASICGIPTLGSGATMTAVRATATSTTGTPVVTGGATLTAVAGTGTGTITPPTVSVAVSTTAVRATGASNSPINNVVTGIMNASVTGTAATGTGVARTATITGLASAGVLAIPAQGTGTGRTPTVTGIMNASTSVIRAFGNGSAAAPIVDGGSIMSMPVVVGSGVVTGWFGAGFNASPDADGYADLVPEIGGVTFTPVHSRLLYPTASPSPLVLFPKKVVCAIGVGIDAGYLLGTNGARGVHLIATDYIVSFQVTGETVPDLPLTIVNNTTTDLATLITAAP